MSTVRDGLTLTFNQLENVLEQVMDNMLMVPVNMRVLFKETVIQYALNEISKSAENPVDSIAEIKDNNIVQEKEEGNA